MSGTNLSGRHFKPLLKRAELPAIRLHDRSTTAADGEKNEINTFFRSGQVNDDRRKQSCVDLGSRLHFLRIQLKSKVEAKKFVLRMGTHGAEGVTSATGYPTGVAGCRFMRAAKGEPLHYG
jgi:hypothetical protein